ncbi:hypothetical protein [Streptomyces sasae]|uniref:hypothetical protein n=1 Tax=Streptomyces sasae TaxID=1266772 RepID=UPI0029311CB5|nr:hypothetical protein [Streptomyces sasae]
MNTRNRIALAAATAATAAGLALASPAAQADPAKPQAAVTSNRAGFALAAGTGTGHAEVSFSGSLPHNGKPYYLDGSAVTIGKCKVWMNGLYRSNGFHVQGLVQSWRDQCEMWLERWNGKHWKMVSADHWVQPWDDTAKDNTGWYKDNGHYWAHVCLYNMDSDALTKCSRNF